MKNQSLYKVAVLLPVMNEAKLIERCLTSIVNQDLTSVVVLIQENCSDDGSSEIIEKFREAFPNVHVFHNQKRVDSWKNWDLLFNNAMDFFEFEYLFWIGGDDYFNDQNFLRVLYSAAEVGKLQIVTPSVNLINGETGKLMESLKISLNSRFMLCRTLKYCNSWKNVNMFHSLISKDLYTQTLQVANNSHTNYIGNDWWIGLSILSRSKVSSMQKCFFNKSQWGARRYVWTTGTAELAPKKQLPLRFMNFLEHIFQDFYLLRNHVLRSHPIRNNLPRQQFAMTVILFSFRAFAMPLIRILVYILLKLRLY